MTNLGFRTPASLRVASSSISSTTNFVSLCPPSTFPKIPFEMDNILKNLLILSKTDKVMALFIHFLDSIPMMASIVRFLELGKTIGIGSQHHKDFHQILLNLLEFGKTKKLWNNPAFQFFSKLITQPQTKGDETARKERDFELLDPFLNKKQTIQNLFIECFESSTFNFESKIFYFVENGLIHENQDLTKNFRFREYLASGIGSAIYAFNARKDISDSQKTIFNGFLIDLVVKLNLEMENRFLLELVFMNESTYQLSTTKSVQVLLSHLLRITDWKSKRSCFEYVMKAAANLNLNENSSGRGSSEVASGGPRGIGGGDGGDTQKSIPKRLNASMCLNFITAFLYDPETKMGHRQMNSIEKSIPPTLHQFTKSEINGIVDLIIDEKKHLNTADGAGGGAGDGGVGDGGRGSGGQNESFPIFLYRISLLTACINQNPRTNLNNLISHLEYLNQNPQDRITFRYQLLTSSSGRSSCLLPLPPI